MKNGYKHKTGAFGTSAENYVSRLFMMAHVKNGKRRPDMVSAEEYHKQPFILEVKSGKDGKGIMVDYQLHYAIRTREAYKEMFGHEPPEIKIETELFGDVSMPRRKLRGGSLLPYYYCVIDRTDGLNADELDRAYSTLKCEFGDIYIVPNEFGFYNFAAAVSRRTKRNVESVISDLRQMMQKDALNWSASESLERKLNPNSWQNLNGRDIRAVYEADTSKSSKEGAERIRIISQTYPAFDSLQRVQIPGPNDSTIYVLAEPEENGLFNKQLRSVVSERAGVIEKVTRARKRALPILEKILPTGYTTENESNFKQFSYLYNELEKEARKSLEQDEIERLERLVRWLDVGEKEIRTNLAK